MILVVDHIGLSCDDISYGARLLTESGFITRFVQKCVPNHPLKKPFLTSYEPEHAIAYCRSGQGISIELIQHSEPLLYRISPYQVLFTRPPVDTTPFTGVLPLNWQEAMRSALECSNPLTALWRPLHAQFWYNGRLDIPAPLSVKALLVPVSDLSSARKFWVDGLGFRVIEAGSIGEKYCWLHIAIHAPVPAWSLEIVLAQGETTTEPCYLDSAGFSCLALLSSSVIVDRDRAVEMGGLEPTEKFVLKVGGKCLDIVLLRGPDKEIIEMIGLSKG
jgi:hypothetical protein